MAIDTAGDLIAFALRTSGITGVGQTPSPEDSNDGLVLLRALMAEWQTKRWMVWTLRDATFTSTGAYTYTIGPSMNFNIPRPDRLSSAFARMLPAGDNPIDYPLAIIQSREDYQQIIVRGLSSMPVAVWYESAYPTGLLYFWPVPPAGQYGLYVSCKAALPIPAALTDSIAMPGEYMQALIYSLAVRLAINYGQTPSPSIVGAMRMAMNTVRMANAQIPLQHMPPVGNRRGAVASGSSPWFQSGGML